MPECDVEIESPVDLTYAVSRFAVMASVIMVSDVDWEGDPSEPGGPYAVSLVTEDGPLTAQVSAIIGGGALLDVVEQTEETDVLAARYFAVRSSGRYNWECVEVSSGDGSSAHYRDALLKAARYIMCI